MRKSKFTDSQIMNAVKRVEAGFVVRDICRKLGISTATCYKGRGKYGGHGCVHDEPHEGARSICGSNPARG